MVSEHAPQGQDNAARGNAPSIDHAVPAPSGGQSAGGTATPLNRFSSITYRYLGGRSGQPEPACLPAGPILVRYFDEAGNNCVDVMQVIQEDAGPPSGEAGSPVSIGWQQIVAWCPLAELYL